MSYRSSNEDGFTDIDHSFWFFSVIIECILALFFFIGKKSPLYCFGYIFLLLYQLILVLCITSYESCGLDGFYAFFTIFTFIGYICFFVLLIFGISYNNKYEIVKKMWFIPALVLFLAFLFNLASDCSIENADIYCSNGFSKDDLGFLSFFEMLAVFFGGLWVYSINYTKEDDIIESKLKNSNYEKKVDSTLEIKKYKELLDQGAITQEEYEMKKKELLNIK